MRARRGSGWAQAWLPGMCSTDAVAAVVVRWCCRVLASGGLAQVPRHEDTADFGCLKRPKMDARRPAASIRPVRMELIEA